MSNLKTCSRCGNQVEAQSKFCPQCGSPEFIFADNPVNQQHYTPNQQAYTPDQQSYVPNQQAYYTESAGLRAESAALHAGSAVLCADPAGQLYVDALSPAV